MRIVRRQKTVCLNRGKECYASAAGSWGLAVGGLVMSDDVHGKSSTESRVLHTYNLYLGHAYFFQSGVTEYG